MDDLISRTKNGKQENGKGEEKSTAVLTTEPMDIIHALERLDRALKQAIE